MRKIILSALAIISIAAVSCQKTKINEQTQEPGKKMSLINGGLTTGERHNLVMIEEAKRYGTGYLVAFDTLIDHMAELNDELLDARFHPDTLQLIKTAALSTLKTIGAMENNNHFKANAVWIPLVTSWGADTALISILAPLSDSILLNPTYVNNTGIGLLESSLLYGDDDIVRNGIVSIYENSCEMYEDNTSYPWDFGTADRMLTAYCDALGYKFGYLLAKSMGMGSVGRVLAGEMFSAAFSRYQVH